MKKSLLKITVLALTALAVASLPLTANAQADKPQDKPKKEAPAEKPANPNRAIPFNGKLAAKTDSSITVGERTFQVTAETKIIKNGKAATLADGIIGEPVGGQYQNKDGVLVAKSIRLGAKPEQPEKPTKEPKAKTE